jgi:hypothetical protein
LKYLGLVTIFYASRVRRWDGYNADLEVFGSPVLTSGVEEGEDICFAWDFIAVQRDKMGCFFGAPLIGQD